MKKQSVKFDKGGGFSKGYMSMFASGKKTYTYYIHIEDIQHIVRDTMEKFVIHRDSQGNKIPSIEWGYTDPHKIMNDIFVLAVDSIKVADVYKILNNYKTTKMGWYTNDALSYIKKRIKADQYKGYQPIDWNSLNIQSLYGFNVWDQIAKDTAEELAKDIDRKAIQDLMNNNVLSTATDISSLNDISKLVGYSDKQADTPSKSDGTS